MMLGAVARAGGRVAGRAARMGARHGFRAVRRASRRSRMPVQAAPAIRRPAPSFGSGQRGRAAAIAAVRAAEARHRF